MDAVCHADVPLGIVAWPSAGLVFTLIVKLSYDLWSGTASVSATREPITLERSTPRGAVTVPSDFAPYKPACDVVLVGEDALRTDGQGTLVVGALEKHIAPGTRLGPTATPGLRGNPHDPALGASWARSGFDFRAFQAAPEDQRLSWPTFPLPLAYVRGTERVVTSLSPTGAQAVLIDETGAMPPAEIPLRADLVALEPSRGLCHVSLRGVYVSRGAVPIAPLVVVASGGVLSSYPLSAVLAWPRRTLIEPGLLAGGAPHHDDDPSGGGDEPWGEQTVPLKRSSLADRAAKTSPLAPASEESTESWRTHRFTHPDEEVPSSLGRSPHSPELHRSRPAFFDDPTTTTIIVRQSNDHVTLFDAPAESDDGRSTVLAPATHDEPSDAMPGHEARAFEHALSVLESAVTRGGDARAFERDRLQMARALGQKFAIESALRELASSVPALREAVDSATWGEL
jgi:hypothetical protein